MTTKNNLTGLYALCTAAFWMIFCISISFAAVFLQSRGYSNTELGVVLALGNILGALLGPAMSAQIDLHDRLDPHSFLPFVLIAQALTLLCLLLCPGKSTAVSVIYVLFISFSLSVNSLNLKLYADLGYNGAAVDYGLSRGIGSLAYVLISMGLGLLVRRCSFRVLPYVGLAVTALQALAAVLLRRSTLEYVSKEQTDEPVSRTLVSFLRENKRFSVLLFGTVLLFFSHNTIVNFFINLTVNAGGDTAAMGYLNAAMAFVEIPVILFYARIRGKHSHGSALRFAFVFFVLKALAFSFAGSIPLLFAAILLQAPSFALYTAAIVDYVDEEIPHADSAKAQSLAFSMTTAGSVLASILSGWNFDRLGVQKTLLIGTAAALFGALIAAAGIKRTN